MEAGEIKAKLNKEILEVTWSALQPYEKRGVLICVDRSIQLTDAGTAVAIDDSQWIATWMEQGTIYKPSPKQSEAWAEDALKLFSMIIVQPFVLVQEMSDEERDALLIERAEKKADA